MQRACEFGFPNKSLPVSDITFSLFMTSSDMWPLLLTFRRFKDDKNFSADLAVVTIKRTARFLARVAVFAECLRAKDRPCLKMLEIRTFYCWQNEKLKFWLFLCLLSKRLNLSARKQNKNGYFGSPYTTSIRRRHIFFWNDSFNFHYKVAYLIFKEHLDFIANFRSNGRP